jgi:hypothetical protein
VLRVVLCCVLFLSHHHQQHQQHQQQLHEQVETVEIIQRQLLHQKPLVKASHDGHLSTDMLISLHEVCLVFQSRGLSVVV